MTAMLHALRHRGPDSTGFAVYGEPSPGDYVMRVKVAEREDMGKGHGIMDQIKERIAEVDKRLSEHDAKIKERDNATAYALRYVISHDGDTDDMARHIEEPPVTGRPSSTPWGHVAFPFTGTWVYTGKNDMLADYQFSHGTLANRVGWTRANNAYYYLDGIPNQDFISGSGTYMPRATNTSNASARAS